MSNSVTRVMNSLLQAMGMICLILFFIAIGAGAVPTSVLAQSPWQWKMSLSVNKRGDSMYMPSAVAFDAKDKRYYVVDTGRNRLVSFGLDGKLLKAFTAGDRLQAPFDMVRLDNGQLWVVEKGRNSLTLIDLARQKVEPNVLKNRGRLVFPDRLTVMAGKLHLLDRSSGEVLRLNSDLSIDQRFSCDDCKSGFADFVADNGDILALEPTAKTIYRFNKAGSITETIELGDAPDFPVSLAVGPSGFYYVLDRHQNSVLVYDQQGRFRYSFMKSGQSPGQVYFARQLRFDPWERLCVVDEGNGRVEIFGR